jgi:hypothetical protein
MTIGVSFGVQTPKTREQWTHANLKLVDLIHRRPYSKGGLGSRYVFEDLKEKRADPEIADLLDDIYSLLESPESHDGPCQSTINPRKTKRSGWYDPVLYSILESPIQRDTGTDPMPPPTVSDKIIQVDTEELKVMRTCMEMTADPGRFDPGIVAEMIGRRNILGMFPVREALRPLADTVCAETHSTTISVGGYAAQSDTPLNRDPWVLVGLGSVLRRRPVLAATDGVHEDALRRLARMERITTNPFNEMNQRRVVITVNEFPTTRLGPRRFRTSMIRTGHVINLDGLVLDRDQIDEYVRHNATHSGTGSAADARNRVEDPFQQVARTQRSNILSGPRYTPADEPTPNHAAPFWQRLGIRVPVPRVWTLDET